MMSQHWCVRLPAGHTNSKDEDVCDFVQNDQSATAAALITWARGLGWKRSSETVFFFFFLGNEKWSGKRSEWKQQGQFVRHGHNTVYCVAEMCTDVGIANELALARPVS